MIIEDFVSTLAGVNVAKLKSWNSVVEAENQTQIWRLISINKKLAFRGALLWPFPDFMN